MINIHTHMHIALMDGQEIKTLLSKFMDLWLFNFVKYALPINAVSKNLWFYAHILLALLLAVVVVVVVVVLGVSLPS